MLRGTVDKGCYYPWRDKYGGVSDSSVDNAWRVVGGFAGGVASVFNGDCTSGLAVGMWHFRSGGMGYDEVASD